MGSTIIRKSNPKDLEDIAKLIYYTEKYPNEEWGGTCKEECYNNIKKLINSKGTRYSYNYIWVAEKDEKVLGIIILIPFNKLNKLTFKTSLITTQLLKGIGNKVEYVLSSIEYLIFKEYVRGTLYVSNIATYPNSRGGGIGKILMNFAEKKSKDLGYKGVSLIAKSEEVSNFYKKLDYKKIFDKNVFGEQIIKMEKMISILILE